jgi:hypothetical protein
MIIFVRGLGLKLKRTEGRPSTQLGVKISLDDYVKHNDVTLKEATRYLAKVIK